MRKISLTAMSSFSLSSLALFAAVSVCNGVFESRQIGEIPTIMYRERKSHQSLVLLLLAVLVAVASDLGSTLNATWMASGLSLVMRQRLTLAPSELYQCVVCSPLQDFIEPSRALRFRSRLAAFLLAISA